MGESKAPLFKLKRVDMGDASEKRAFNQSLFRVVAPAYGRVTGVLSFGQDRRWKDILVGLLPEVAPDGVCVDLACGTGDLCDALARRFKSVRVVGIDQNPEMLAIAKNRRRPSRNTLFLRCDMQSLALEEGSVDVLTGGYAIRNAPNLVATIEELRRVLKPGAAAAFLDFSTPRSRTARAVELALLRLWGNLWGAVFHGNPEVYGYIAESLSRFPNRESLTRLLADHGFDTLTTRYFFFGFLEIRLIRKANRRDQ